MQLTHDESIKTHTAFSPDGSRIAYGTTGLNWQIGSGLDGSWARYSQSGRIYFDVLEAGQRYLYRMKDDGTQEEKVSNEPIVYTSAVSPDGRFVVVRRALNREDNWWEVQALPVSGGSWVPLCSG